MADRDRGFLAGAVRRLPAGSYDRMLESHPNHEAAGTINNWNNFAENSNPEAFGYATRHWGPAIQSLSDVMARRYELRNGRPTGFNEEDRMGRVRGVWQGIHSEAELHGVDPNDTEAVLAYGARTDRTGNFQRTLELLRSQGILR